MKNPPPHMCAGAWLGSRRKKKVHKKKEKRRKNKKKKQKRHRATIWREAPEKAGMNHHWVVFKSFHCTGCKGWLQTRLRSELRFKKEKKRKGKKRKMVQKEQDCGSDTSGLQKPDRWAEQLHPGALNVEVVR